MTRIAVSGHRGLSNEIARYVDHHIRETLSSDLRDLVGLSCLADGADQMFATAVLDLGGELEVVVPAGKYRDGLPDEAKPSYDALFAKARKVHTLDFVESTSTAHQAASEHMMDLADLLLAVWDGLPARSYGGTADVVAYAKEQGKPVVVIWPPGATRD